MDAPDGYLDSNPRLLVTESDGDSAGSGSPYACVVPLDEVPARGLAVGDVVRLDDPQAHRVEGVLISDGRVVLELRTVGLAVPDAIHVTVSADAIIDRLGAAED